MVIDWFFVLVLFSFLSASQLFRPDLNNSVYDLNAKILFVCRSGLPNNLRTSQTSGRNLSFASHKRLQQ